MKFARHGQFKLFIDGQIIYYKPVGAWNKEASEIAIEKLKQAVISIAPKPIAFIIDTSELEGFTTESAPDWQSAIEFWHANGNKALVRIDDPDSTLYKVFLAPFDEYFKQTLDFNVSDDIENGLQWLWEKGFEGFVSNDLKSLIEHSEYRGE